MSRRRNGNHQNWLAKQERIKRDQWFAAEQERLRRQEALWLALPPCEEVENLKRGMMERARALFDEARLEEGDALLEFLPTADVRELLDDYFDEELSGEASPATRQSAA